jgi:type II secretory pathway pseudopilin PulG
MNWLKRNLYLVLGALAALVLLGLTGFYLYQQRQKEREVTSALDAQINEWKRLTSRNPSANEENIEAAKKEQERLSELLQTNREFYVPTATFTNMDSATFKTLLETTIYDLEQLASRSGVSLPRQYNFTAGRLRASVVFQEAELLPLAYQLVEIKALCEVLFDARIHSLVRIRRVPVSKQDTSSSEYLTGSKITTNAVTGAVVTPYEVTFQGFSSELAAVIAGLQRSRHAFIVKMMDVEHAADAGPAAMPDMPYAIPGGGVPMPTMPTTPQTAEQQMRQRYGQAPGGPRGGPGVGRGSEFSQRYGMGPGGRPPGMAPGTVYAPVAPTRRGPETVLEEKQLKVTLTVDAVRLPLTGT